MANSNPRINGSGCRIVFHGDKVDEKGRECKNPGAASSRPRQSTSLAAQK
jgi:hypothetical protein